MRPSALGAGCELRWAVLHRRSYDGCVCRPVCPVPPARSTNVSFFPSAAAAEAAGYRPCLRCRPETAPFSGAWIGSRATAERAMRLIVIEGALDQEGATVESLAARLGMGTRQLTRLFARHLYASPSKVARTTRVQRAKRLIDQTNLPMTEIAMQAGFGSTPLQLNLRGGLWSASNRNPVRPAGINRLGENIMRIASTVIGATFPFSLSPAEVS